MSQIKFELASISNKGSSNFRGLKLFCCLPSIRLHSWIFVKTNKWYFGVVVSQLVFENYLLLSGISCAFNYIRIGVTQGSILGHLLFVYIIK